MLLSPQLVESPAMRVGHPTASRDAPALARGVGDIGRVGAGGTVDRASTSSLLTQAFQDGPHDR